MKRERKKYADEKKHKITPKRPNVGPLHKPRPTQKPSRNKTTKILVLEFLRGNTKN
jgi:hypothetical protein